MERITAAARTAADNGHGAVSGEILWQESCVLGYVIFNIKEQRVDWHDADYGTGWARFMEWKYPVEISISSPKTFKLAGAVEAAATL